MSEQKLAPWRNAWIPACQAWSLYVRLAPPRLCLTQKEAKKEGLSGSFAMIRLSDHAIVIDTATAKLKGLDRFAVQILAHEIGHHLFAPGDLADMARIHAAIRRALGTAASHTALVANLYTDLFINDRLQRQAGLDMAAVYQALEAQRTEPPDDLWCLYLRIYEILWGIPAGGLMKNKVSSALQGDARLGARLIQVYARNPLAGAGGFALLFEPYLSSQNGSAADWTDAIQPGSGDQIPDGLTRAESGAAIHPAFDPSIGGTPQETPHAPPTPKNSAEPGPQEYRDVLEGLGVKVSPEQARIHYYKEKARPYTIRIPQLPAPTAIDPQPEGLNRWEPGSALEEIDWVQSLFQSPSPIPGFTLVERQYGTTPGHTPRTIPLDLYLGIDCSGSMPNPARTLSWPVVAGTALVRSALRAGAAVQVCLSGEPGSHVETPDFIRDEKELLTVLTSYLGTGYAFGVERLREHILEPRRPRPTHLIVISDQDWFMMLNRTPGGWELAEQAAKKAGATAALNLSPESHGPDQSRLRGLGWDIQYVRTPAELTTFARTFSDKHYRRRA